MNQHNNLGSRKQLQNQVETITSNKKKKIRQSDKQTDRQRDKEQTDRQTNGHTYR